MNVKRRLSDDEIAKIIEDMGPTPVGARVETSTTTLYDLALELQDYRAVPPRPSFAEGPLYTPTPVEALAERLAKVEDRLASTPMLDGVNRELKESFRRIDQRIDKVAEVIGERVSGLVDEMTTLRDRLDMLVADGAVGFPTGGASTAEAAADAVLPVPQRGDRVRLEGAKSTGQTHIKDGWYEVTGRYDQKFPGDHDQFQVGSVGSMGLYWVYDTDPGLKEVRHADHT